MDFEWSEKNPNACLEWGYAALRSGHVQGSGIWPPKTTDECGFTDHDRNPLTRRREGHFIISDYVDKAVNKRFTNFPLDLVQSETHRSASDILPSLGKLN